MSESLRTTDKASLRIAEALRKLGLEPRLRGAQWSCRCPGHKDRKPSLSFRQTDGQALLRCHAGCETVDVMAALGLGMADLYDDPHAGVRYDYTNAGGAVTRSVHRTADKRFRQTGATKDQPQLYRLPAVIAAVAAGVEVHLVEGEKDVHALESVGAVATTNPMGSTSWPKVDCEPLRGAHVVVVPDRDAAGDRWLLDVQSSLAGVAATMRLARPLIGKDAADHVAAGHDATQLVICAISTFEPADLHSVFRRWLGTSYDLIALDAVVAAAAAGQLTGDPVWLLLVSGAGNAKTETVIALAGAGARVTSTITSEGALLSATSSKDHAPGASGGLLRAIGDSGILVIKDFTSILAMSRETRASVLAALREVHDGRWERNVGTDGGKTLCWTGRITVIGAVTTAYDDAHQVISSMGNRFVQIRVDSGVGRIASGWQALQNLGDEVKMREELATAMGQLLSGMDCTKATITNLEKHQLLRMADFVTLARTTVRHDSRGNPTEPHAPEAPTRLAKMLGQLLRGALAVGLSREAALQVAVRAAGDSLLPLRRDVLTDLLLHPSSRSSEIATRTKRSGTAVSRELEEQRLLGLAETKPAAGRGNLYSLASSVDLEVPNQLFTGNVTRPGCEKEAPVPSVPDIPGDPLVGASVRPPMSSDLVRSPASGTSLAGPRKAEPWVEQKLWTGLRRECGEATLAVDDERRPVHRDCVGGEGI